MTEEFADRFAAEWLQAWNERDLERILGHYADSIEFTSPFAQALLGVASGTVVYRSVNDLLAAEVMEIDQDAKITRVNAHYRR